MSPAQQSFAESLASQAFSNCGDADTGVAFTIEDAINSFQWVAMQLAAIDHRNTHVEAVVAMRRAAEILEAEVMIDLGRTG